ncbi:MAG TPA: hypothetical protein VF658_05295 [Pyrinomonadaceae bacterium]|jgi:hypothetical protein
MLKRLLTAALIVCVLALNGFAQKVCNRHIEPQGSFSFCLPAGWTVVEKPELKYKTLFGPRNGVFTPNINLRDEDNEAPLAQYVADSLKLILSNYQEVGATSVQVLAQSNFKTESGVDAIKVTLSTEYQGLNIRTQQYYIDGNYKLIVTCTALEAESAALDPVFDSVMKSFKAD